MHRYMLATSLVLCATVATGACNRNPDKMTTAAESETQAAQPANTPITVAGCVKAGEAENTYVLTTARTEGTSEAATYELIGERTADLRDQIGRRVEVSGTVQGGQEIASRSTAKPADEEPTGTSGTPTVQTRSEIDIKRMSVSSLKPLGEPCEP